jgi:hypothetical protein
MKLKDFNKKSKLHALERFFFKGSAFLNDLMHDPWALWQRFTVLFLNHFQDPAFLESKKY